MQRLETHFSLFSQKFKPLPTGSLTPFQYLFMAPFHPIFWLLASLSQHDYLLHSLPTPSTHLLIAPRSTSYLLSSSMPLSPTSSLTLVKLFWTLWLHFVIHFSKKTLFHSPSSSRRFLKMLVSRLMLHWGSKLLIPFWWELLGQALQSCIRSNGTFSSWSTWCSPVSKLGCSC